MMMDSSATTDTEQKPRWMQVDAWGRTLAKRRGAINVETGEWLIAVRSEQVHRHLGLGTLFEYVEKVLGLEPHAAAERLRVAEIIEGLPELREALRTGERSWSVARELTRVAVAETEREWLEATEGKSVREVEKIVSGRRPGQRPSDPSDPRLRRKVLRFEVTGETYALFREAVRVLHREVDPHLSEEQVLAEMARRVLGGPCDEGRAPYQVALTVCEDCGRAFQDGRGEQVEVEPEVLERAECDAQNIGKLDSSSPVGRDRKRATQTIPPAVRRLVLRRDHGRCKVPGCASSSWVEIHHARPRSEGGDHDPSRLFTACSTHHAQIHEGLLLVEGDSVADLRFRHADGTEYGKRPPSGEDVALLASVFSALRHMGFRETEAKRALAEVRSRVGREATLEEVLRLALRVATDGPRGAKGQAA